MKVKYLNVKYLKKTINFNKVFKEIIKSGFEKISYLNFKTGQKEDTVVFCPSEHGTFWH